MKGLVLVKRVGREVARYARLLLSFRWVILSYFVAVSKGLCFSFCRSAIELRRNGREGWGGSSEIDWFLLHFAVLLEIAALPVQPKS